MSRQRRAISENFTHPGNQRRPPFILPQFLAPSQQNHSSKKLYLPSKTTFPRKRVQLAKITPRLFKLRLIFPSPPPQNCRVAIKEFRQHFAPVHSKRSSIIIPFQTSPLDNPQQLSPSMEKNRKRGVAVTKEITKVGPRCLFLEYCECIR